MHTYCVMSLGTRELKSDCPSHNLTLLSIGIVARMRVHTHMQCIIIYGKGSESKSHGHTLSHCGMRG